MPSADETLNATFSEGFLFDLDRNFQLKNPSVPARSYVNPITQQYQDEARRRSAELDELKYLARKARTAARFTAAKGPVFNPGTTEERKAAYSLPALNAPLKACILLLLLDLVLGLCDGVRIGAHTCGKEGFGLSGRALKLSPGDLALPALPSILLDALVALSDRQLYSKELLRTEAYRLIVEVNSDRCLIRAEWLPAKSEWYKKKIANQEWHDKTYTTDQWV